MDVSEWTAVDESAKQMLLRVMRGKLPVLKSFSPLYQVSLHAGDVLEVAGPSGSAKSEFLLQMAVECILPKEHDGVVYGGCGAAVVWFDLDCRFDRLRFLEVVRSRLRASVPDAERVEADVVEGEKDLYTACLRRFNYVRCYTSVEFLAALKTFGPKLHKITEEHKNGVQLLIIDSIGAFYWLDRACQQVPYAVEDISRVGLSLQVVSEVVVRELRKLLQMHHMLVVASKTFLSNGAGDSPGKQVSKAIGRFMHREYMSAAWQGIVTRRLLLHGPYDPELLKSKWGHAPVFLAEWHTPFKDKIDAFVVKDAGIVMIS